MTETLKSNYVYSMVMVLQTLLFPIITTPYITRVFGIENYGILAFSISVINWLQVIATYWIVNYGIREIAKARENQDQLNRVYSELIIFRGVLSILVFILFFISIEYVELLKKNSLLFQIMSFSLVLNVFSIDWLFQGLEKYKFIALRTLSVKMISIFFVFIVVKSPDDLLWYACISVLQIFLINLMNYFSAKRYVTLIFIGIDVIRHCKPASVFFISAFIYSMYHSLDVVMIGFLHSSSSVGFYSIAKQIIQAILSIILAINVFVPRVSNAYYKSQKEYYLLISQSFHYFIMLSIPCVITILFYAKPILHLIAGQTFEVAFLLLQILSPVLILYVLSNWLYHQVILPSESEAIALPIQTGVAIATLIANVFVIPSWNYVGVGVVIFFAELMGLCLMRYAVRKKIDFRSIHIRIRSYIFGGIIQTIFLIMIRVVFPNQIKYWVTEIITSSFIYLLVLILCQDPIAKILFKKRLPYQR